jgi:hypothetical protein
MLCEDGESSRSHGLPKPILEKQAENIGVQSVFRSASWDDYEEEFIAALKEFKKGGIDVGVFGDIDLAPHREWVERVCGIVGITPDLGKLRAIFDPVRHTVKITITDGADKRSLKGPDTVSHAVFIKVFDFLYGNLRSGLIKVAKIRQFFKNTGSVHADCITVPFSLPSGYLAADAGQSPDSSYLLEDFFDVFKRHHLSEMIFFETTRKPGIGEIIVDKGQPLFPLFSFGDILAHRVAEVGEVVFQILVGVDLQEEFPRVVGNIFIPFLAFTVTDTEFTHRVLPVRVRACW